MKRKRESFPFHLLLISFDYLRVLLFVLFIIYETMFLFRQFFAPRQAPKSSLPRNDTTTIGLCILMPPLPFRVI